MPTLTTTVHTLLSLEQLAIALRQLPVEKLEDLELMLDKKFGRMILKRGKTAWREYKEEKTLSLAQLRKEFSQ